jgi:hypothetical protein
MFQWERRGLEEEEEELKDFTPSRTLPPLCAYSPFAEKLQRAEHYALLTSTT